jgi:hypothetical protein
MQNVCIFVLDFVCMFNALSDRAYSIGCMVGYEEEEQCEENLLQLSICA